MMVATGTIEDDAAPGAIELKEDTAWVIPVKTAGETEMHEAEAVGGVEPVEGMGSATGTAASRIGLAQSTVFEVALEARPSEGSLELLQTESEADGRMLDARGCFRI